jgi:CDP-glucose 4,6-dehydratase
MLKGGAPGEWNFGPEIDLDTKVSRVADLAAKSWGDGATWDLDSNPQLHEAGYLLLDSSKARTELSWRDKLDFESTISWTLDFYKAAVADGSSRELLEVQVAEFLAL